MQTPPKKNLLLRLFSVENFNKWKISIMSLEFLLGLGVPWVLGKWYLCLQTISKTKRKITIYFPFNS